MRVKVTPKPIHCGEFEVGLGGVAGKVVTVIEAVVLIHPVVVFVNVKVAEPADNPVIMPALVTDAAPLLLTQVPPVVGDKVVVLPTQIVELPVILTGGNALIVIAEVVLVHPVEVNAKVKVAEPAATPVTTPPLDTIAIPVLLLAQVPPVVGESVVEPPTHIAELPVMLTVGNGFTVKEEGLVAVPPEVVILIVPEVAVRGTVAVICVAVLTV